MLDAPSWTLPYDHALSEALARRGHRVHLLASPFMHGPSPVPAGYVREDVFLPRSSRLAQGAARARGSARPCAGSSTSPSARRARRRIDELRPDIVHVQWLGIPRYDRRWLRGLAEAYPTVLTAHEVLPPRTAHQEGFWLEAFAAVDRVVVHSRGSGERLVGLGVDPAKLVEIPHPGLRLLERDAARGRADRDDAASSSASSASTRAWTSSSRRCPRSWRRCRRRGSWSPATPWSRSSRCATWPRAWAWPTASTGGSATSRATASPR